MWLRLIINKQKNTIGKDWTNDLKLPTQINKNHLPLHQTYIYQTLIIFNRKLNIILNKQIKATQKIENFKTTRNNKELLVQEINKDLPKMMEEVMVDMF